MRRLGCAAFLWIVSALTVQPAEAQATVNVRIVVAPSSRLGFAQAPGTTGADRAEVAAFTRSAAATHLDASSATSMSMTGAKRNDVDSEGSRIERSETVASTSLCAASQPRWAVATGSAAQLTVSRRLARTSETTGTPQPARPIVLCTLVAP